MFRESIFRAMDREKMIPEGSRVAAGVSGGADSVCLLLILCKYRRAHGFDLKVVHVEHGLRGEESRADAAFVQALCAKLDVPCEIVRVDAAAAAKREKLTVEEAGRKLRYQAFREALPEGGVIALAHNLDDQAETVLLNLARGSGIQGLGGIRPVREEIVPSGKPGNAAACPAQNRAGTRVYRLIRPLLGQRRTQIENWLLDQGQTWRTDATNLEDHYARNRIRHHILPVMEREINERTYEHLAQTASMAAAESSYLTGRARQWIRENADSSGSLLSDDPSEKDLAAPEHSGSLRVSARRLREMEEVPRLYILREAVRTVKGGNGLKDIGLSHIRALESLAGHDGSAHLDLPGLKADRDGDDLILRAAGREKPDRFVRRACENRHGKTGPETITDPPEVLLDHEGAYRFGGWHFEVRFLTGMEARRRPIPEKQYTKWLACDRMLQYPSLRTRRPGDYLTVNREGGRQKLRKYLIDSKVPASRRDQLIVAACGSHVLWAVGMRISEDAKVTEDTQRVICIQALPGEGKAYDRESEYTD